jgi:hypothetical protein
VRKKGKTTLQKFSHKENFHCIIILKCATQHKTYGWRKKLFHHDAEGGMER